MERLTTPLQPDLPIHLSQAFAADPERFSHFSQTLFLPTLDDADAIIQHTPHRIFCDLSKNLIDRAIEAQLLALAQQADLPAKRDAMFKGDAINSTEGRAAWHVRLRHPQDDTVGQARQVFLSYAESIRANMHITDIVNIGIGGSDLGPALAVQALDQWVDHRKKYHFVSNSDGHEINRVLRQCKPQSTLFIVASKSFSTHETLMNATAARQWFLAQGGTADGSSPLDTRHHFCAVTANMQAANHFGIHTIFDFWDWVGGRYSLWSAIGLALAIAVGAKAFKAFLAGAHAIDQHFQTAPLARNLPVRLGLLDVYYRSFLGFNSRCIAPYAATLERLPAYLQQLEMESNGKSVMLSGEPVNMATAPIIWGQVGTNGQHAFFQMLHQGTDVIPVEFIALQNPTYQAGLHCALDVATQTRHHQILLANAIAQGQALMHGQANANRHRHFAGNRPSTFILLSALTPITLGALIALYEHRVFVSGTLWGINSFDQFGVELGKVLAKDITPRLVNGNTTGLDASTAGLILEIVNTSA